MSPFRSRKLIDRLIIALIFTIILIVVLVLYNINSYKEMSKQLQMQSKLNQQTIPHPTVVRRTKIDFIRSSERSNSAVHNRAVESISLNENITDTFVDLYDAIEKIEVENVKNKSSASPDSQIKPVAMPTLGDLLNMKISAKTTNLDRFHMQITANEMYPENSVFVDKLLNDMATMPIVNVEERDGGTQFKATITYRNGMKALFKPKRLNINQTNAPNQAYYSEFERHNAEIAAFHVDRLLGFRRALPTCGRKINIVTEFQSVSAPNLKGTFFKSLKPDENICFTGNCKMFCDNNHPICGNGSELEGSFMAYLPDDVAAARATRSHPYRRTYSPSKTADWETNPNFCDQVKEQFPMKGSRHLLDFMDTSILDFLIGNADRHNYQQFRIFNGPFHMHYDHGRSFGRPLFDDFSILMPLTQCCLIRESTLKTLLSYHHGPKPLSMALRESLSNDPIAPVLLEPHLEAVDRRIQLILKELRTCITKKPIKNVIICS